MSKASGLVVDASKIANDFDDVIILYLNLIFKQISSPLDAAITKKKRALKKVETKFANQGA